MAAMPRTHLSTVVMHHPSRAERLPALLEALAELEPRVVADPEPDGPASPLRTAKRAWAEIAPGATHHLVLQDDVRPVPGFAAMVHRIIAARPHDGICLYVNWNSPQNAYRVRQAAASGLPFAELSDLEYTPTLGLVLPAVAAAALASHLLTLPDRLRDDDEAVTRFRRACGLDVVATVPNLLDHGGERSLAGNGDHGTRHSVVHHPDPSSLLAPDHWSRPAVPVRDADAGRPDCWDYAVELVDSTCRIRPARALRAERIEHPFGWPWYEWCTLIGVDRERIVDGWRGADTSGIRAGLALEYWAACYLLGADVRRGPGTWPTPFLRAALDSWIASGLGAADRACLTTADREVLVELGVTAFHRGRGDAGSGAASPAPVFEAAAGLEATRV